MNRLSQVLATLVVALLASAARAQTFDLSWYTIDGGGGMHATGGNFELSGTIGQPDAGAVMTGGGFVLVGGFWSGGIAGAPCNGFAPCDTNCDGSVNGFDVDSFVGLLTGAGTACAPCSGDVNDDGSVNGFDVEPFVDALTGTGC